MTKQERAEMLLKTAESQLTEWKARYAMEQDKWQGLIPSEQIREEELKLLAVSSEYAAAFVEYTKWMLAINHQPNEAVLAYLFDGTEPDTLFGQLQVKSLWGMLDTHISWEKRLSDEEVKKRREKGEVWQNLYAVKLNYDHYLLAIQAERQATSDLRDFLRQRYPLIHDPETYDPKLRELADAVQNPKRIFMSCDLTDTKNIEITREDIREFEATHQEYLAYVNQLGAK